MVALVQHQEVSTARMAIIQYLIPLLLRVVVAAHLIILSLAQMAVLAVAVLANLVVMAAPQLKALAAATVAQLTVKAVAAVALVQQDKRLHLHQQVVMAVRV